MFFQFNGTKKEIPASALDKNLLTAGFVSVDELEEVYAALGFAESTVNSCRSANSFFRSGVEVYDDYTFTELRIIDTDGKQDDCVAVYISDNIFIVVDVEDRDGSTKSKFLQSTERYPVENITLEKLVYAFFDNLVSNDIRVLEKLGIELTELEEQLSENGAGKDFNLELLRHKKLLLRLHNYYEQILDITESVDENENGIFRTDNLMYINNITKRVQRLKEDADSLKNTLEHLQDAYNAYLDAKLNNTMKVFTVLTSIFFPLTIIVGWYGMNFQHMPEYTWKYGYVYVIALSAVVVAVLFVIGKRKKWF